jgi:hypothetical protein
VFVVPYSLPLPLLCDLCAFPLVLLVCWFGTVLQMYSGIRVPATLNPVTDDGAFGYLDAMGFLVKHHPIDFNMGEADDVDYSLWGYESESLSTGGHALIATKSIQAGEELFYSFHSHPHGGLLSKQTNLFKDFPLADDYDTADAIVKDLIVQFKATGKPIKKVRAKQIGKRIDVLQLCSNRAICTLTHALVAMLWVGIFDYFQSSTIYRRWVEGGEGIRGSIQCQSSLLTTHLGERFDEICQVAISFDPTLCNAKIFLHGPRGWSRWRSGNVPGRRRMDVSPFHC